MNDFYDEVGDTTLEEEWQVQALDHKYGWFDIHKAIAFNDAQDAFLLLRNVERRIGGGRKFRVIRRRKVFAVDVISTDKEEEEEA